MWRTIPTTIRCISMRNIESFVHRGMRGVLLAAIGVAFVLAGCAPAAAPNQSASPSRVASASETPAPSPSSAAEAAEYIDVLCDENLNLVVSAPAVRTMPNGVPISAASEVPGAYLHYGVGGDEMPTEPTYWPLPVPPGEMTLSCSTPEKEGPTVIVEVVDPDGNWPGATYEDYGCPIGGIPDWAIETGVGETPEEAVAALAKNHNDFPADPALTRWEHAAVAYPEAYMQYWILGTDDNTIMTAMVYPDDAGYRASPDMLCDSSTWLDPS